MLTVGNFLSVIRLGFPTKVVNLELKGGLAQQGSGK